VDLFLPFKDFGIDECWYMATWRARRWVGRVDGDGDRPERRLDIDGAQVAGADVRAAFWADVSNAGSSTALPPYPTQLEFRGTLNGDACAPRWDCPPALRSAGPTDWRAP